MSDFAPDEADRRQAVRVTGRNLFYFQIISKGKFQGIQKDFEDGIPPYNHEGLSDIQMFICAQSALARIRERDADLAEFLLHLDTKINLILKKITDSKTIFDKLSLYDLNISGKGVSFITNQRIAKDEILEFHIALLPTYTYVYCFGKVISCTAALDEGREDYYRIAAEFILIMEEDQEKLIQHNFKQQSLALRNRRLRG